MTQPATLLQLFPKFVLDSYVLFKNTINADDTCREVSEYEWVTQGYLNTYSWIKMLFYLEHVPNTAKNGWKKFLQK